MHNIHWAVIFSNGAITVAFLAIACVFLATARRNKGKGKPTDIGAGDKVKVVLAASSETYTGVVEGVTTASSPGKFSIICTRTGTGV